jgi:hypothetical protein
MENLDRQDGFIEFFDQFLPEFEFSLRDLSGALSKLEELREYYANHPVASDVPDATDGRTAVIALSSQDSWSSEIKTSALFADQIVCDDPLLFALDDYQGFSRHNIRDFGIKRTDEWALADLRRRLDELWQLMPLVHAGVLRFHSLRMLYSGASNPVRIAVANYLKNNLEISFPDPGWFPVIADAYIPIIDEHRNLIIDLSDLEELGMTPVDQATERLEPFLFFHLVTTLVGLRAADLVFGTFWTGLDWHWRLCQQAVRSLSPETKIYSFVHAFAGPALDAASVNDLLSIRTQEDAFYNFRKEMVLAGNLIKSFPGDSDFGAQIERIFLDIFEPNFSTIESVMSRNIILRNLPWIAASSGFAYAAAVAASDPLPAAIFGTLSAAFGFGPLFREIADKRTSIRREPAYVFWKLNQLKKGAT